MRYIPTHFVWVLITTLTVTASFAQDRAPLVALYDGTKAKKRGDLLIEINSIESVEFKRLQGSPVTTTQKGPRTGPLVYNLMNRGKLIVKLELDKEHSRKLTALSREKHPVFVFIGGEFNFDYKIEEIWKPPILQLTVSNSCLRFLEEKIDIVGPIKTREQISALSLSETLSLSEAISAQWISTPIQCKIDPDAFYFLSEPVARAP